MSPTPRAAFPRLLRITGLVLPLAGLLSAGLASADEPDSLARASVDSVRVTEGDAGQTQATFTVRLTRLPASGQDSLAFATEDGSARAGEDYLPAMGTLALNDSDLVYPVVVSVVGDSIVEGNEWFRLRLSNPGPGVALADSIGLAVIVNDEPARFELRDAGLTPYLSGNLPPAFADANGDVFPDLPLDRNHGFGTFRPMPGMAAALTWGNHHGSAWCDYDRDGDPDFVIAPYAESDSSSRLQLLRNLGNGTFEDVAPTLGMDAGGHAETPVWGDFDGDGWPDLFVPFYAHEPPGRSFLWRNQGDGTFVERAEQAGVAMADVPELFKPEGADAADWNGDGSLDLYCASRLFLNDGTGQFTDVRAQVGLPEMFDEGARFVDVDNDGDLDLYLRNWTGPRLFRNDSSAYVEVTAEAGLPPRPLYWGDSWADADNDGDLDLMLMNFAAPSDLFVNRGDGTFVADSAHAALGLPSSVSAWADVDLDDDLDVSVGASERRLLVNQLDQRPGAAAAALRVWVLDADSMLACPGAIARLREIGGAPGRTQTRVVDGGSGYLTQSEYPLHFGGVGSGRYSLEVRYPGSASTATVIDGSVNPALADFSPSEIGMSYLFVFRDGRVSWRPAGPRNPLSVGPGPRGLPAGALGPVAPVPARERISFSVRLDGRSGELSVHDLAGRRVRSLGRTTSATEVRRIQWDLRDDAGRAVPSGIYFLRLSVEGSVTGERRVLVVR